MEWKKKVDTNLGITVILMFAAIFTIIDFYVVCSHIDGYPFNDVSGNTINNSNNDNTVVEDKDVIEENDNQIENNKLLSEDDALKIGNELFEKMGGYNIGRGPKEIDSNGKVVGYTKADDNSFSVIDNSDGMAFYYKLDKKKLSLIATEDYIRDYFNIYDFILYNGDYYGISGDRGSDISYIDTKLEILSITENTVVFNAVSTYFSDFSYQEGLLTAEDAPKENKINTFRIVKEGNNWKISEFHAVY